VWVLIQPVYCMYLHTLSGTIPYARGTFYKEGLRRRVETFVVRRTWLVTFQYKAMTVCPFYLIFLCNPLRMLRQFFQKMMRFHCSCSKSPCSTPTLNNAVHDEQLRRIKVPCTKSQRNGNRIRVTSDMSMLSGVLATCYLYTYLLTKIMTVEDGETYTLALMQN
jgi:hypothetical protein